jgi:hypothetical protein
MLIGGAAVPPNCGGVEVAVGGGVTAGGIGVLVGVAVGLGVEVGVGAGVSVGVFVGTGVSVGDGVESGARIVAVNAVPSTKSVGPGEIAKSTTVPAFTVAGSV